MTGAATIRLRSLRDGLDSLAFTANALAIDGAEVDGRPVRTEVVDGRRVFHLSRPLAAGRAARLSVRYHGAPARGLSFGTGVAWTAYFTCDWMVCEQDDPGDKATLDLALALPRGMTAFASGRLVSRTPLPGGLERQLWRERRPYPAYLFGFAAGPYQRAELAGPHGTRLVLLGERARPQRLKALFADTGRMVAFFEDKAGVALPGGRYGQVLIDGDEAQEASDFSVIGTDELDPILADPHEDWAVAHELAHQWWGNLVTCRAWSDLWLNEGLTVFMVAAWKEQRWGRADYDREMRIARQRWDRAKAANFDVPLAYAGDYPLARHPPRDPIQQGRPVLRPAPTAPGRGGVLAGRPRLHPRPCRRRRIRPGPAARPGAGERKRPVGPVRRLGLWPGGCGHAAGAMIRTLASALRPSASTTPSR